MLIPDWENAIKEWEDVLSRDPLDAPWDLIDDTLALLKAQEPAEAKVMVESNSHGSWWFSCGACGHAIYPEDNFCWECGRKVRWE